MNGEEPIHLVRTLALWYPVIAIPAGVVIGLLVLLGINADEWVRDFWNYMKEDEDDDR
ncbi:hypothetical protein AB3K78_01215 [Leucobacter sp. HNU]|uniref:hypothetical protein n=1 Tax=Leucobacter sp. HNU TaxID=3236805 RepID=UPI003A8021AF